jgi:DNA polymerase-3 subunit gamma/tau
MGQRAGSRADRGQVEAATPGIDLDDEPPLDEDYIEPDMDSAYSYLDDLASEHTAEPAPSPRRNPLPHRRPAWPCNGWNCFRNCRFPA